MNNKQWYKLVTFGVVAVTVLGVSSSLSQMWFSHLLTDYGAYLFWSIWLILAWWMFKVLQGKALRNETNRHIRDIIQSSEVLYQNSRSSGRSFSSKHWGGASNCLKIVVTVDTMYVTATPIFSAFSADFDLEHIIPKSTIISIRKKRQLFRQGFVITYVDDADFKHRLEIWPRQVNSFEHALNAYHKYVPAAA